MPEDRGLAIETDKGVPDRPSGNSARFAAPTVVRLAEGETEDVEIQFMPR
jgi:hypothetical protein